MKTASPDELLDYIFDGRKVAFYPEFEGWLRESRRFRAFVTPYRSKIRAKLKNTRDADGLADLRAELETAALLLRDTRFTVEYEKYAPLKQRGPDFTVLYRANTPFNVEVRRVRAIDFADEDDNARAGRLIGVMMDKVGQMPPGILNLLWLVAESEITSDDLARMTNELRRLVERKDDGFFTRHGFDNAADFQKQYARMSGMVIRYSGINFCRPNPMARQKIPGEIIRAVTQL